MKKFIAFMIVALPLTAILSMVAGFWYAANTRQARRAPMVMDVPTQFLPAATSAPAIPAQLSTMSVGRSPVEGSIEEMQYLARLGDITKRNEQAADRIVSYMQNSALGSSAWRMGVEMVFQQFDASVSDTRALTPPASMRNVHATILKMADEMEAYTTNARLAIKEISPEKMRVALNHMENATGLAGEVNRQIKEMDAEFTQK